MAAIANIAGRVNIGVDPVDGADVRGAGLVGCCVGATVGCDVGAAVLGAGVVGVGVAVIGCGVGGGGGATRNVAVAIGDQKIFVVSFTPRIGR